MSAVSIDNGYFAAGSAVLMVTVLLATTTLSLTVVNGVKNVAVLVSDGVAALIFVVFGAVSWAAVVLVSAGLLIRSSIGPAIVRRLPPTVLRRVIAAAGLALAVVLAVLTS